MSFDDKNEEARISKGEIEKGFEDREKYFTSPVYTEEEMAEKFRDWEPLTNYHAEITKEEHRFSDKANVHFVKIVSRFKVKNDKTKIISDVFMMYPEIHQYFKRAYGKQSEFLRAIGVKRESDTFVNLGFVGKTYNATLTENPDPAWARNPNIHYIDAGDMEKIKARKGEFDDDIGF